MDSFACARPRPVLVYPVFSMARSTGLELREDAMLLLPKTPVRLPAPSLWKFWMPCALTALTILPGSSLAAENDPWSPAGSAASSVSWLQQDSLFPEPAGVLEMQDALSAALRGNPTLAASRWEVRAADATRMQAGLRRNPELSVSLEDFAGTGSYGGMGASQATVELSQAVELGGKRGARQDVARHALAGAGWDHEAARLDVIRVTRERFVEVVAAQRALKMAGEAVQWADETARAAAERVRAGGASPVERARADAAAARARIDLEWAKHRLEEARENLGAAWGQREPTFTEAQDELDSVPPIPSFDLLIERVEQNPALRRIASDREREAALQAVEKSLAVPDVTVSGGYRRLGLTDDNALVAGVSVPLPLLNRNQGRIVESRHRMAATDKRQQAARLELQLQVAEAYKVATTALTEIDLLRRTVLPETRSAFETTHAGYRQGRYAHLELQDAQRLLLEAHTQYLNALVACHRAVAQLEALTGLPERK
jgi:cobalt-zinc-cadmium efflux system outer membrane protein